MAEILWILQDQSGELAHRADTGGLECQTDRVRPEPKKSAWFVTLFAAAT